MDRDVLARGCQASPALGRLSMAGILFSTYFHIKVEYDVDAINRCFKLYVDYMPSKIIHRWLRNHTKTHSTTIM